jgi:multidrug efflux pump subunit AcrA (membrane-fusion protein)
MRRRISLVIVLIGLLALAAACSIKPSTSARTTGSDGNAQATPTPVPTPLVSVKSTYTVQKGRVTSNAIFTGRIVPVQQDELFYRTDGRVRKIMVSQYQNVKAGDVLADLEIDNLERDLELTKLDLARSQVTAETAEKARQNNIKRAQLNLEVAQLNLDAAKKQDPAPRKTQAEADLQRAQIALTQAQEAYNEIAWRNDKGTTPQSAALQQATLNMADAKATYDLAMQAIATYQDDLAVKERQVQLAQVALDELNQQGTDPLLQNDIDRANLNVQKLEASIKDAQVVAPYDGQVLDIGISEGDQVQAFKRVMLFANPNELEVSADPGAEASSDLSESMPVTVTLDNKPGEVIMGSVRSLPYLYSKTDSTQTQDQALTTQDLMKKTLRISLAPKADQATLYKTGDLVKVTVMLKQKDNVLWLPPVALRTFQGNTFVVVRDGNVEKRVNLQTGITSDERVEIVSGLSEGQVVVGQ